MDDPFFNPYAPIAIHTRNLPHWEQPGALVFITWRLADSLPATLLKTWQVERTAWLEQHPAPWGAAIELAYRRRCPAKLEQSLDAGHGSCVLRQPDCCGYVEASLRHLDGQHYVLDGFVVMPNHVHLIVRLVPGHSLPNIVKSLKNFSARQINQRLGLSGPLWQEGYWDRLVRDASHLYRCRDYLRHNPIKASLAPDACRLHISENVY